MRKGEAHSAESRAKISAAMKGKRKSDDTRRAMSFAATSRWARDRNRRRKLQAIMGIGVQQEVLVEAPKAITEAFHTDGSPI